MTYRLSRKAEDDIVAIYVTGVREFGFDQAERYHAALAQIFEFLAENPRGARERTELDPPVRAHRYKAHLIIYRLDGSDILILRVRHGREDWLNRD
ncbi:MAG: type II toxin-antitoxin system RelE/ParE family toxin [Pseudomonadota bacterium]